MYELCRARWLSTTAVDYAHRSTVTFCGLQLRAVTDQLAW